MRFVTIGQLRTQCKVDDSEDDLELTACGNDAESRCERLANRNFYVTENEMRVDIIAKAAALGDASAAYTTAVGAIGFDEPPMVMDGKHRAAIAKLNAASVAHEMAVNGLLVNDDIRRAILLTAGKYFRHHEDTTDERISALPGGAERIMRHYRYAGDL